MGVSLGTDLQMLCEQLLKLTEKEEQALIADNIEELEACVKRKEEIVKKLRELESKKGHNEPLEYSEQAASLLERIIISQERVSDSIKAMLGECQDAILEIRAGQQAQRAYYRTRKKGRERSTRLL
jgi:hypothetical protein